MSFSADSGCLFAVVSHRVSVCPFSCLPLRMCVRACMVRACIGAYSAEVLGPLGSLGWLDLVAFVDLRVAPGMCFRGLLRFGIRPQTILDF